jgi:hypothetical protein
LIQQHEIVTKLLDTATAALAFLSSGQVPI